MRVSRLTTLLSAGLLAACVSVAAAQVSSSPGMPGSAASDAANTQCWDKATNKLRNNVKLSETTASGSVAGSGAGGSSGRSNASVGTSPSGASPTGAASTRPAGVRDCLDE